MTEIPDVRVGDKFVFEYPNEPQFNCELTVTRIDLDVTNVGESLVHFDDWSHSKLKHMGSIKRKAKVPWTFDEIVEFYKNSGDKYLMNAKVWKRSEISNLSVNRGSCLCGGCWSHDQKVCVCGQDYVTARQNCLSCGRPVWCER